MTLTESQTEAMLEIGGSAEPHGFIPQRDLNDLLSYGLIFLRTADEAVFTPAGEEVYEELTGSARTTVSKG